MAKKKYQPDELALLAAVHASPKDDTVRLAYADWLEENGDPGYAEFIRWQIRNPAELKIPRPSATTLARWKTETPPALDERMSQSLGLNFGPWARPFPSESSVAVFHRGLPLCKMPWILNVPADYDRLLTMNPRLRFQLGLDESTFTFLAHPVFTRADIVSLCPRGVGGYTPEEAIRALAAWPGLAALRSVILYRVQDPVRVRGLFPPTVTLQIFTN